MKASGSPYANWTSGISAKPTTFISAHHAVNYASHSPQEKEPPSHVPSFLYHPSVLIGRGAQRYPHTVGSKEPAKPGPSAAELKATDAWRQSRLRRGVGITGDYIFGSGAACAFAGSSFVRFESIKSNPPPRMKSRKKEEENLVLSVSCSVFIIIV